MKIKHLAIIVALSLGWLAGCSGGLSLTDVPRGPHNGFTYIPAVVTPPVETYQDRGSWKASCFDTLPASVYQNASLAAWADQIFSEVNAARVAAGVPALVRSNGLDKVEQAHCRDTMLRRYFGHDTPEGWNVAQRLEFAQLKDYSMALQAVTAPGARVVSSIIVGEVAENAARGYESAHGIVQGWLNSANHRATLMDPHYKYVGTGVYFYDPDNDMPINAFQIYVREMPLAP